MFWEKKEYYCDGICEDCEKGKLYETKEGNYYTCDPKKVKGLKVITPCFPYMEVKSNGND